MEVSHVVAKLLYRADGAMADASATVNDVQIAVAATTDEADVGVSRVASDVSAFADNALVDLNAKIGEDKSRI